MLDYTFVFNPSKAWSNLYQFEGLLQEFFTNKGFDPIPMTMAKGQSGRSGIFLVPKEMVAVPEEKPKKPIEVKDQVKNLQKDQKQVIREKSGKYAG